MPILFFIIFVFVSMLPALIIISLVKIKEAIFNKFVSPTKKINQGIELKIDGELFKKYIKLAKENFENKNYTSAIDLYDKAILLNNSKSFCFNNRGYCKSRMENYAGAVDDYSNAIDLNQDEAMYFANRGMTYWKWNKKDDAYKDWRQASILGSEYANKWLKKYFNLSTDIASPTSSSFLDVLKKNSITRLFHFTDRSNLQSIITHGV